MHPDAPALESVATTLELLTTQVVAIADRHRADPDDVLTPQLDELERSLVGATRRLQRTIRGLEGRGAPG
jgi:hypothetical protein